MPYLTLDEALDLVEDMCGEEEAKTIGKDGNFHETKLSKFASDIYKIIHAHRRRCKNRHEDWLVKKAD